MKIIDYLRHRNPQGLTGAVLKLDARYHLCLRKDVSNEDWSFIHPQEIETWDIWAFKVRGYWDYL